MDQELLDHIVEQYRLVQVTTAESGSSLSYSLGTSVEVESLATLITTELGLSSDVVSLLPSGLTIYRFDIARTTNANGGVAFYVCVGLSSSATFSCGTTTLPQALPSVSFPGILLQVRYSNGQTYWSLRVNGLLTFNAGGATPISFAVVADFPAKRLSASLVGSGQMSALLSQFGFGVTGLNLGNLALSSAVFAVDLQNSAFSVDVLVTNTLPTAGTTTAGSNTLAVPLNTGMGATSFTLNRVALSYLKNGSDISGWISGESTFAPSAGVAFDIAMRYSWGPNAGWSFAGSLAKGSVLTLASLCPGLTLPPALQNATVTAAQVLYDGPAQKFTFSGTLANVVTVGTTTFDFSFRLKIDRSSGSPVYTLEASVLVNGLLFNVNLGTSASSTMLVASYSNPTGQSIGLQTLVELLGVTNITPSIPSQMTFQLQSAVIAFGRTPAVGSAPATNKVLLAAEMAAGFDLTDLPLVGERLPPNQTLRAVFQPTVASAAFTAEELTAVNAAIPAGGPSLPNTAPLAAGFSIQSTLNFGDTAVHLPLPIGTNTTGDLVAITPPPATSPSSNGPGLEIDGVRWFPVQQKYGPVYVDRVGTRLAGSALSIYLGANLSAGGLTISLQGLSITTPLDTLQPTFGLLGLGIDYKQGELEIGGAFLSMPVAAGDPPVYSGIAVIRTKAMALTAMGSYTTVAGEASLFLYATLDKVLGGPSFFFVTGLTAGFGYNRKLLLPAIDDVATFPLVQQAASIGAAPSPTATVPALNLTSTLTALTASIPPALNEKFFAVGVKFTSFKLIDSFALLTVSAGEELRIDVLGHSTVVLPPQATTPAGTPALAEVELNLNASLIPSKGELKVDAKLAASSYILSRDCHLTGGFAFYAWFHTGDFVLSLGGYHPGYRKPDHYPKVDRLGVNWKVTPEFSIKGACYCALTPSAIMAGGSFEAIWEDDNSRASFNTNTDLLVSWQPYFYTAEMAVRIAASHTFTFPWTWTAKGEGRAVLRVWGPEFSGQADVHIGCFSFEVTFGNSTAVAQGLTLPEFQSAFLPASAQSNSIAVQAGQVGASTTSGSLGTLNPTTLQIAINTVIPTKTFQIGSGVVTNATVQNLGIYPMGLNASAFSASQLQVSVSNAAGPVESSFVFTPILKAVPSALWGSLSGNSPSAVLSPPLNNASFPEMISGALMGFTMTPQTAAPTAVASLSTQSLQHSTTCSNAFAWETMVNFTPASPAPNAAARRAQIVSALSSATVTQNRQNLIAALGVDAQVNIGDPTAVANSFLIAPIPGVYA